MSSREFVNPHAPPLCKKCKVVLNYPQDLQKNRRKWWSNCQNCRTANTVKERKRRNSMTTAPANVPSKRPSSYGQTPAASSDNRQAVKKRKHTDSIWPSSALDTSETRKSVQHPDIETAERCAECNTHWIGFRRFTSCGHLLCSTCYLVGAYASDQHICKACNEVITSYHNNEPPKLASNYGEAEGDALPKTSRDPLHECSVCGEYKPSSELVEIKACTHEPDTCTDCIRGWITSQFETSVQDGIRCPSSTCNTKLTHADIKEHASSEDFAR